MSGDAWLFWAALAGWNVALTLWLLGHGHQIGLARGGTRMLGRARRRDRRPALLLVRSERGKK